MYDAIIRSSDKVISFAPSCILPTFLDVSLLLPLYYILYLDNPFELEYFIRLDGDIFNRRLFSNDDEISDNCTYL